MEISGKEVTRARKVAPKSTLLIPKREAKDSLHNSHNKPLISVIIARKAKKAIALYA